MRIKVILSIWVVGLLVEIIKCQKENTGIHECIPPPIPQIIPLTEESNIQDKYPSEEVNRLLQNRTLAQRYREARRNNRYCSRGIPIEGPGDPGDGSVARPPPNWSNTCPSYTRYYYIPKKVWYGRVNQYCWVLPPWRQTLCSYATCVNPLCKHVQAAARGAPGSPGPPIRCLQSRWERIYYFVICRNPWQLYQRYIELPRSCSCEQLKC